MSILSKEGSFINEVKQSSNSCHKNVFSPVGTKELRHYVIFIVPSGCHRRARASVVCLFHVLAFGFSWRLLNL